MRGLSYLLEAFTLLSEDSYQMHEIEAVSFIPYLVNKVGDPKDQVRGSIRNIFKTLAKVRREFHSSDRGWVFYTSSPFI